MPDPTVRPATVADVDAIRSVATTAWRAAYEDLLAASTIDAALAEWYDPAVLRERIEDGSPRVFVATVDGEVVGYVSGGSDDALPNADGAVATATVGALYVHPERWGEGVGTALLERFAEHAREDGADELRLRAVADNDVGTSFYRSRGFEAVDELRTAVFGEAVTETVFRRPLE